MRLRQGTAADHTGWVSHVQKTLSHTQKQSQCPAVNKQNTAFRGEGANDEFRIHVVIAGQMFELTEANNNRAIIR